MLSKSSHLSKRKIRITLVGLDRVGKTHIASKLTCSNSNVRKSRQFGINTTHVEQGRHEIEILDLYCTKSDRESWPEYYPQSHGVIFVYDATDLSRMDEANEEMKKIFKVVEKKPMLIVTTNQNQKHTSGDVEICETSTLINFYTLAGALGCEDMSWSKKNQLKDDFKKLINAIDQHYYSINKRVLLAKKEQYSRKYQNREEDMTLTEDAKIAEQEEQESDECEPTRESPRKKEEFKESPREEIHAGDRLCNMIDCGGDGIEVVTKRINQLPDIVKSEQTREEVIENAETENDKQIYSTDDDFSNSDVSDSESSDTMPKIKLACEKSVEEVIVKTKAAPIPRERRWIVGPKYTATQKKQRKPRKLGDVVKLPKIYYQPPKPLPLVKGTRCLIKKRNY